MKTLSFTRLMTRTYIVIGILFAAGPTSAKPAAPSASLLLAISAADGSELTRHPLPAAPVFDSMSAAAGKLFITLEKHFAMFRLLIPKSSFILFRKH